MSADVPVQLIVAAFDDEAPAKDALEMLKEAKRERMIGIRDAAVLQEDQQGKLHNKGSRRHGWR